MFQTKVVEKINTHILCAVAFFRKSCRLLDNVKKYFRAGQATEVSIIRRMRVACWIPKATKHALRMCNTCFLMHGNIGCTNARYRYIASLVTSYIVC